MRQRFEQQLKIGQLPISEIYINPKSKNALVELIAALKEIYLNKEYNEKVFSILERLIIGKDKNNGRPGMDLWIIFVLAQTRLFMNYSYEHLHNQANNHFLLRSIMGIEQETSFGRIEFEYQHIYDNVSRLSDEMLRDLNDVIVEFAHEEVFKKRKYSIALQNR